MRSEFIYHRVKFSYVDGFSSRQRKRRLDTARDRERERVTFLRALCGREEGSCAAFVVLHRRVEKKRVSFATVLSWFALSCALPFR